ncbi:MAG: TIGR01777 family oxidoreductase [Acidobacteriota bacterium]
MKIVIAGGTGFIGEPLVRSLLGRGDVAVLTRDPAHVRAGRAVLWQPSDGEWTREIADADVVINLAGENIAAGRWSVERKRRLIDSRLEATRALVAALRKTPNPNRTFISASAVGFYGDRADDVMDETSTSGKGFLADLVVKWEEAARAAEAISRLVILRFGVVLDTGGGALAKMLLPFKLGLGGPIGSGRQWMSWIDRMDAVRIVEWAIDNRDARGVYNATAPAPVRNREFSAELGRALHRPAILPAPAFAIRAAFGQMGEETVLAGQRVEPKHALAEGFTFQSPTLRAALERIF